MKIKNIKRFISSILVSLIITNCFISVYAEAQDDTTLDYRASGDKIYSFDFADTSVDNVPDGFLIVDENDINTENGSWIWTNGDVKSTVEITVEGGIHGLKFNSNATDGVLIFPNTDNDNYVVSVDLIVGNSGYLGLLTNISSNIAQSYSAVETYIDIAGTNDAITLKKCLNGKKDYSKQDLKLTDYISKIPEFGEEINFTAYCLNGYTYFYVNGVYISKIEHWDIPNCNCCGIYGCGSSALITSVSVSRIGYSDEVEFVEELKEAYPSDRLFAIDFPETDITEVPDSLRIIDSSDIGSENGPWIWTNGNIKSVMDITTQDGIKGLNFISNATDGVLLLPSVGTGNYVLSVDLTINSSGYIGLLTNISDDVSNSTRCVQTFLDTDSDRAVLRKCFGDNKTYDRQELEITDYISSAPVNGDTIRLTAYSFEGYTYFFVNNVYISRILQWDDPSANTCGIYMCGASALITHINITQISKFENIAHLANNISAETPAWAEKEFSPIKMIDGSTGNGNFYTSTYEDSDCTGKDVYITFENSYVFKSIILYPRMSNGEYAGAFPQDFCVRIWNGNDWIEVVKESGYNEVALQNKFDFDEITGCAVWLHASKLSAADNGNEFALQLSETEIIGRKASIIMQDPIINPSDVTVDTYVIAENPAWAASIPPSNLVNTNYNDLYTSEYTTDSNTKKEIYLSFKDTKKVTALRLFPRLLNGNYYGGFPVDFTVRAWDGNTWQTVAEKSNCQGSNAELDVYFLPINCRAINIIVTKLGALMGDGDGKFGLQLSEIRVMGDEADYSVCRNGDANGDDYVNASDLTIVRRNVLGINGSALTECDVNGDSRVNIFDFLALKKLIVASNSYAEISRIVYYVDASNGSDKNTGTSPTSAFKTLKKVNSLFLKSGDQVLFKSGESWTGTLDITHGGTASNPVIYGKYGDEDLMPAINGNGEKYAVGLRNVLIENLEITNKGDDAEYRRGIYLGAEKSAVSNVTVKNCYVHDVQSKTDIAENDDEHFYGGISAIADNRSKNVIFNNIIIENNTVENCSVVGIGAGGGSSAGDKSVGIAIRNNIVKSNFGDGIILFASDGGLIEKNTVLNNGTCADTSRYFAGIWCIWSDNTVIQYNESAGQGASGDGQGFDIDGICHNTIVQYNYSHDNMGGFLLMLNYNNGTAVVRNNISKNDRDKTFKVVQKDITDRTSSLNAEIYNNTIYSSGVVDSLVFIEGTYDNDMDAAVSFKNNIFCIESESEVRYVNRADSIDLLSFANNCWCGVKYSHNDVSRVCDDPQFSDKNGDIDGMKIKDTSPCIKTGAYIENNGGEDYWGNKLGTVLNIGAYGLNDSCS